jgi:thiazole synthase
MVTVLKSSSSSAVADMQPDSLADPFILAGKTYRSRLLVGTGKYKNMAETKAAVEASGADIITVALRRIDLTKKGEGSLMEVLSPKDYTYLPNSAGCYTAEEAVRTLRLARELGGWKLVKLEVIGDSKTLYPDVQQTLKAAEILVKEGFDVMAYTSDDPVIAKRLEEAGCVAVMPLASPIGSGLGIKNPLNIKMIVDELKVPVLVDAGIGTASDACIAMELGCAGVLLNTALSAAQKPVVMAEAMKAAVIAGRLAYRAGRMPMRESASASSPTQGVLPAVGT